MILEYTAGVSPAYHQVGPPKRINFGYQYSVLFPEPKIFLKSISKFYKPGAEFAVTNKNQAGENEGKSNAIYLYSVTEALSNVAVTMMYRSIKACVTMV